MRAWIVGILLAASPVVQALPCYQGELTPDKAVELALRHSPEVALASFQSALGRAERLRTAAEGNLKISLGMLAARQNSAMVSASGGDPNFLQLLPGGSNLNLNAMAMLPLYNGGWLAHRLAAAEHGERIALAQEQVALQNTCRQARLAYFEVSQARSEVAAAEQELEARQQLLKVVQDRLHSGRVARYVLVRAEAEVAANQQALNSARASFQSREGRLKFSLGLSWESRFDYSESVQPPPPPEDLAKSLELARAQRPDLVATRLAVEEGDEKLLASLAEFSPRLSLVAMAESMHSSAMPWKPGFSVGLSVSFPLFDGGQRSALAEVAQAEVGLRQSALTRLELQVEEEVTSARAGLVEALDNSVLAEIEQARACEEWRIAKMRFELGRGLYLEMLDSLALCARARSNRLKSLFEAQRRQADYLYATGRFP